MRAIIKTRETIKKERFGEKDVITLVDIGFRIRGQRLFFESTSDSLQDQRVLETFDRRVEPLFVRP